MGKGNMYMLSMLSTLYLWHESENFASFDHKERGKVDSKLAATIKPLIQGGKPRITPSENTTRKVRQIN